MADKCLSFSEEQLDAYLNPKTRDASLFTNPVDVSRTFKDAQSILSLFAGILKKTEEAEQDLERTELLRRTVEAIEFATQPQLPIIEDDKERDVS